MFIHQNGREHMKKRKNTVITGSNAEHISNHQALKEHYRHQQHLPKIFKKRLWSSTNTNFLSCFL